MMKNKLAFVATTALAGGLMFAPAAYAQSTGTTEVEAVVITAARGQPTIDGVITAETAPKAKASIDQEFIATQTTGQSIIQTLNLTPGLNFTNSDPYGSSGGNLRIRGFDGNRISLTFDGIPLNDTGNYAIYTNQQLDGELISRASVNMGTTDVDSPTAAATGGTINYTSRRSESEMGAWLKGSVGSFDYRRIFGLFDTGEFGPWGTSAWIAGSKQEYEKFKGPGTLEKWQVNGKVYQPLGDGDFISLAFHYNENRNNFYRTTTMANFELFGRDYDNLSVCTRDPATAGTADNDNNSAAMFNPALNNGAAAADNPAYTSSCGNFYGVRINPSNTGNVRQQARFGLTDDLTLTFDSAFQYVLANGGGSTAVSETATVVRGSSGLAGFDLNGDGDTLDTVRFYSPNTTNTRRATVMSSLIWDMNDDHTFRFAYTFDRGNHRQTGQYGYLSAAGHPEDVFGGKDGYGSKVFNADGYALRSRDRQSFAILNQISAEWRGQFMDDNLFVTVGLRAPFFKRELNQYCYTQNNSGTVLCTTQTPVANVDIDPGTAGVQASANLVTFAGSGTQYIRPFEAEVEYEDVLPNIGAAYTFMPGHTVYMSYAEGLAAPRTDQLYTAGVQSVTDIIRLTDVQPETTKAWDLGYRFRSPQWIVSAAVWYNTFENRIVSSFDPDLGFSVDRNVGNVEMKGFDAQAGWTPSPQFSVYASVSYTDSELQDDLLLRVTPTTTFLPLKGKKLVETPDWMFGLRGQWNPTESLSVGFQGKKVGERFTTDVNDEVTPGYMVFDFDMRYDLPWLNEKGAYIQLNVTNVFDEDYYGNISSGTNAKTIADIDPGPGVVSRGPNTAFVSIGAPRTVQLTLSTKF
ncbi:MAG: TonB-dependent receptor [Caulobacter sp.]|nr:TonB-dependent receptor [Caulobacter sp.]